MRSQEIGNRALLIAMLALNTNACMLIAAGLVENDRKPLGGPVSSSVTDEQRAAIRRTPTVPELGATGPETRVICERQHGEFTEKTKAVQCAVGGATIFECLRDAENRMSRCNSYFENGNLAEHRERLAADLGDPTSETVSADGFRVFSWETDTKIVAVTMYAKGVRVMVARP